MDFEMGTESNRIERNTECSIKDGWRCSICTYDNDEERRTCGMCRAERPDKSLEEMFAQQSRIEWHCLKCNTSNNGNQIRCVKCRAIGTWSVESGRDENPPLSGDKGVNQADDGASFDPLVDKETSKQRDYQLGVFKQFQGFRIRAVSDVCETPPASELRVVLLGRTGEGKSATGNTILGTDVFESVLSPASVTKGCQRGTCTRFGRYIQVIDTPGMYDTEMSIPDITREVVKCVGMTAPGPHAFLLVIKPGRITEELQSTIEHFMKMFGSGMEKYLIIVFTKKDDLMNSGKTIEKYLERDAGQLQGLLALCNNRYVAFNNRGTPHLKEKDVKSLIGLIDDVIKVNGGVYTSEMFEQAERIMYEKEEQLRREHAENIQRHIRKIERVCYRRLRSVEETYEDITHQLQERLQKLEDQQTTDRSCEDVEDIRKQLLDMKAQHEEEIKLIKSRAGTDKEEVMNQQVNYREEARSDVDEGTSFFSDTLAPGLFQLGKMALPLLYHALMSYAKTKEL